MILRPSLRGLYRITNVSFNGTIFTGPASTALVLRGGLDDLDQTPILAPRHIS